jgi:hypothetical protein
MYRQFPDFESTSTFTSFTAWTDDNDDPNTSSDLQLPYEAVPFPDPPHLEDYLRYYLAVPRPDPAESTHLSTGYLPVPGGMTFEQSLHRLRYLVSYAFGFTGTIVGFILGLWIAFAAATPTLIYSASTLAVLTTWIEALTPQAILNACVLPGDTFLIRSDVDPFANLSIIPQLEGSIKVPQLPADEAFALFGTYNCPGCSGRGYNNETYTYYETKTSPGYWKTMGNPNLDPPIWTVWEPGSSYSVEKTGSRKVPCSSCGSRGILSRTPQEAEEVWEERKRQVEPLVSEFNACRSQISEAIQARNRLTQWRAAMIARWVRTDSPVP